MNDALLLKLLGGWGLEVGRILHPCCTLYEFLPACPVP